MCRHGPCWCGPDRRVTPEFCRRYLAELDAEPQHWRPLLEAARAGDVTFLYAARDRDRNSASLLRDYLLDRLGEH